MNGRCETTPALPCPAARSGFTLIELLLVMGMLVIVLSVSAPLLVRFFHGRDLDSEAHRLLGLIRYGQNRAVSEGMPMVLWMDPKQGLYGLEEESSYAVSQNRALETDERALEFELGADLEIEVEQTPPLATLTQGVPYKQPRPSLSRRPEIRLTPEGFIGESSPEYIIVRYAGEGSERRGDEEIYIGRTEHRLTYEIKSNNVQRARR